MKKLLPSITLAVASLAASSGFASAGGTFGLFTGCRCCKSCGGTITLRQYNAFSPVACGSMMFQGCVVAPPPAQPPAYGYSDGLSYGGAFSSDCPDGSCGSGIPISQLPAVPQGGVYYYPSAAYTYAPVMQPAFIPANAMPAGPVQVTQPTSARLP